MITASLSALDAFHYFGMHDAAGLFHLNSPGLWAIAAIALIGAFNFMGPKHTAGFAIAAALAMIGITLVVVACAVPQANWSNFTHAAPLPTGGFGHVWIQFTQIVLALSGVEAIASMSGVLKKPVARTAGRSIAVVAGEVALFNVLLAAIMVLVMHNTTPESAEHHKADMMAHLAATYGGVAIEWVVRIVGGVLLLSAANTAIGGMIAVLYVLARDSELPASMQKLNSFGVPVIPALIATAIPVTVLAFIHDLETLSHLYAIGVVGAVAINIMLCSFHPRLYHFYRKAPMAVLGVLLIAIWITLAYFKREALVFVVIVMVIGLSARALTKALQKRAGEKPSLIRKAIQELFKPEVAAMPKMLLGTYGSDALAMPAIHLARSRGAALIVCFVRELSFSDRFASVQNNMTIDTDPAALRTFSRFLELGHQEGVPVIPAYDTGPDAAALMGETAALYGCDHVLIGTSRQHAMHRFVKGSFQKRLESILPPEIKVDVLVPERTDAPVVAAAH
ncbi:MAG: universal stress protein [Tepidisphaeraceae bacterium]